MQSAHKLGEAQRELGWEHSFDLAIFDEAHHTATKKHSYGAHALNDDNVRIQRRVSKDEVVCVCVWPCEH